MRMLSFMLSQPETMISDNKLKRSTRLRMEGYGFILECQHQICKEGVWIFVFVCLGSGGGGVLGGRVRGKG